MEHMNRKYKPENAMLRPHKETTLEKQEKMRQSKKTSTELAPEGNNKGLNVLENKRMKRKAALLMAMNKVTDKDPTLD